MPRFSVDYGTRSAAYRFASRPAPRRYGLWSTPSRSRSTNRVHSAAISARSGRATLFSISCSF